MYADQRLVVYSTNALKQLKGLATDLAKTSEAKESGKKTNTKTGLPDCCICKFTFSRQSEPSMRHGFLNFQSNPNSN
jgi:hypothetical protein